MKTYFFFFILLFSGSLLAQSSKDFKKEICDYRDEYKAKFLKDQRSPFYGDEKGLKKLKFFKPNKEFLVECTFEATPAAKPFEIPTYSGQLKPFKQYGILTFNVDGKEHQLAVYQNLRLQRLPGFKKNLFLPFKDLTNNESTYGGGRYINLNTDDLKKTPILLDFNKCYNPWCAYSDGYNCPIPPKENHLDIAVEAGEKQYSGKIKHQ